MNNDGPDVLDALEPAQRTEALAQPLPRRRLGPRTVILLWLLRVYVLFAVPLVVYMFVRTILAR